MASEPPQRSVLVTDDFEAVVALVGQDLGVSSWHDVTQARVNAFAEATEDYSPIHVDPEAARSQGLETTIAHGLYILSLGFKFLRQVWDIDGLGSGLNYGYERVRFTAMVPTGTRVRMRAKINDMVQTAGGYKAFIEQRFEVYGQERPACVATLVLYWPTASYNGIVRS